MALSSTTPLSLSQLEFGIREPEVGDEVEQPSRAGDDPVAATARQMPREHLEDAFPFVGAASDGRIDHGQLVLVGQEGTHGVRSAGHR